MKPPQLYPSQEWTWADWRCAIIHRFILRRWALSGKALGLGAFGPTYECLRCRRPWA